MPKLLTKIFLVKTSIGVAAAKIQDNTLGKSLVHFSRAHNSITG